VDGIPLSIRNSLNLKGEYDREGNFKKKWNWNISGGQKSDGEGRIRGTGLNRWKTSKQRFQAPSAWLVNGRSGRSHKGVPNEERETQTLKVSNKRLEAKRKNSSWGETKPRKRVGTESEATKVCKTR